MATAGQFEQDDAATQLALIYADGNKVGAFLSEAAKAAREGGRPAKSDIVPALDQATLAALADAIIDRFRGWPRPPVLANLAGGDDLLVSVPAIDAWMFVRTLLEAFGQRIDAATRGWPESVRDQLPSLSAGLVFHHMTAPFSDVVRIAEEQLRAAKKARRGTEPTVAFLDLTADGGHQPPGREPLTLAYLTGKAGLLERIEQIPRAAGRRWSRCTGRPSRPAPEAARTLRRPVRNLSGGSPIWTTGRCGKRWPGQAPVPKTRGKH